MSKFSPRKLARTKAKKTGVSFVNPATVTRVFRPSVAVAYLRAMQPQGRAADDSEVLNDALVGQFQSCLAWARGAGVTLDTSHVELLNARLERPYNHTGGITKLRAVLVKERAGIVVLSERAHFCDEPLATELVTSLEAQGIQVRFADEKPTTQPIAAVPAAQDSGQALSDALADEALRTASTPSQGEPN